MPDSLGWRGNWGVIAPSTNTSVQPEYDDMRPRGITNHHVRIWIPDNPVHSDADFNKTIKFMVGPGKMADLRTADVLWTGVMDAVHHRGQFSVYLRMAGGKVPSIYGPSADEPWM